MPDYYDPAWDQSTREQWADYYRRRDEAAAADARFRASIADTQQYWTQQQAQQQAATAPDEIALLQERARLEREAFDYKQRALQPSISALMGPSGSSGTSTSLDSIEAAARDAAFSRAKDTAGAVGRSSIDALQNTMAARGAFTPGGRNSALSAGEAGLIGRTANLLGEQSRGQAESDVDAAREAAGQRLQADIARRGQNVDMAQSLYALMGSGSLY